MLVIATPHRRQCLWVSPIDRQCFRVSMSAVVSSSSSNITEASSGSNSGKKTLLALNSLCHHSFCLHGIGWLSIVCNATNKCHVLVSTLSVATVVVVWSIDFVHVFVYCWQQIADVATHQTYLPTHFGWVVLDRTTWSKIDLLLIIALRSPNTQPALISAHQIGMRHRRRSSRHKQRVRTAF